MRRHNLRFVHSLVATSVSGRKPIIFYLPRGGTSSVREQSKHILALSEVARQVRSTREQPNPSAAITEFALKPFVFVGIVFVPFQITGTAALMGTEIAGEHLPLQVKVGEVLVTNIGGCETFGAGWTFIGTISTVAPGVPFDAIGVLVWRGTKGAHPTSNPPAKDLAVDIMSGFEMLM